MHTIISHQFRLLKKNYDEAYKTYVKIIALNPNDYDSILQAAKISYNRKNYSLAMKYLEYIPEDYEYFHIAHQMYRDAKTLFDAEKNKIERAKITTVPQPQFEEIGDDDELPF